MSRTRTGRFAGVAFSALASFLALANVAPAVAACTALELEPFLGHGTAALEGTVTGKVKHEVRFAARQPVEIFPLTPCFEAWWRQPASHNFRNGIPQPNYPESDRLFESAVRRAMTTDKGQFAIYDLPAGRYRLRVPWLKEVPLAYSVELSGKYLSTEVVLSPGRTTVVKIKP